MLLKRAESNFREMLEGVGRGLPKPNTESESGIELGSGRDGNVTECGFEKEEGGGL